MTLSTVRVFWWSPWRMPRLAANELRHHGGRWARLAAMSGRTLTNFGDQFSPLAVSRALGVNVEWAHPREAQVVALGSILELYAQCGGRGALVWGAGVRSTSSADIVAGSLGQVFALRGPLSSEALSAEERLDVVLADPGVLISEFVAGRRPGGRNRLSYLPHFGAWSTAEGRDSIEHFRSMGANILSPTARPLDVARELCASSMVVTSSLHALIFCHALAVPVQLVDLPGHHEPEFKYADYAGSMGWQLSRLSAADLSSRQSVLAVWEELSPHVMDVADRSAGLASELTASADRLLSELR